METDVGQEGAVSGISGETYLSCDYDSNFVAVETFPGTSASKL